jgi:cobalamin biosynthesis Co2+ chelatase CbiK
VDDKSINTTYFYLRDRAISITQNIYIISEPILHTIHELDLVITPLRDIATSLRNNIVLVCSGDNHTIQYCYRNMPMIDNEAQDKTHDTFID